MALGQKSQAEGTVTAVYQNATKKAGVFSYNFYLDNGDKKTFRCGIKNPHVEKGDSVSFIYEEKEFNGKPTFEVDVNSIKKTVYSPQSTPTPKTVSKSNNPGARDEMDLKNRMTAWHAARASAIEILAAADEMGGVETIHKLSVQLYQQTVDFLIKKPEVVESVPEVPFTHPDTATTKAVEEAMDEDTQEEPVKEVKVAKAVGKFNF